MAKRFDYELEKAMDGAIMLLSKAFSESGHNPKPVILHSIRVGMTLFDHGYSRDIVLAGLLHDILEDTNYPSEDLQKHFGVNVAKIVQAATLALSISDKREQNMDVFLRCRSAGFDALIVKCADILDNIDYFVPTPGYEAMAEILMQKYHDFLNVASDGIGSEPIFSALKAKVAHAEKLMDELQSK